MAILLLGISHHTAPVEERERVAISDAELPEALSRLTSEPGVQEGMILSTCNRVEILVAADDSFAFPALRRVLAQVTGGAALPAEALFYQHRGTGAARHLFRVASSLDSLIVGEPQILGQLKQAYLTARSAGAAGSQLDGLLARAFHAAKRVRTETRVASQPVSVSQAAVDLAKQIFGELSHKTVLLLGAGAMGESAARYLMRQGAARLLLTNRTFARAELLAAKFGGEAFPFEQLPQRGDQADVVITCTGAAHPLVSRAQAAQFLARRRGRPMLYLDVAVPRDVDPAVHQLENAFVYNVDDLDKVVSSNLAERRQEALRGEAILDAELALYLQRRQERDLAPTLRALQMQAEELRRAEWERMRKRLGPLSSEQEAAVEALTRSLMQKWLHQPLVRLKAEVSEAPTPADRSALLELVHRLFALLDEETPASGPGDGAAL